MKNLKKEIEWNKDKKYKKTRPGRNLQVTNELIMATHGYIINKQDNNECLFYYVRLTVDHFLWDCKETEAERQRTNIQNKIWDKRKDGMKQLSRYISSQAGLPFFVYN
jgi:hypothetical protein